jgi:hypothetical protein
LKYDRQKTRQNLKTAKTYFSESELTPAAGSSQGKKLSRQNLGSTG